MYLEKFSFDSPKLLIFYLGGNISGSHIEMHDVVFIVAKTDEEASKKIKDKWCGTEKSLHVDSWFVAEEIDGYNITVLQQQPLTKNIHLYFVNLGYYKTGVFGECHFMTLMPAESKIDAIEKTKKKCSHELEMLHSDNVYDLDDCICIDEVDRYFISLDYTNEFKQPKAPINGYQKLRMTSDKNP